MKPVPLERTHAQLRLCAGLRVWFEIKLFMSVTSSKLWPWRNLLGIEVVLFEYVFFQSQRWSRKNSDSGTGKLHCTTSNTGGYKTRLMSYKTDS